MFPLLPNPLSNTVSNPQPGALPSALDFNTFADSNSWRTRSDTAQILRPNAQPGLYYVGVYNDGDDIQEAANYSVTLLWSRSAPLCPWNCNGNGNCTANGTCKCNPGALPPPPSSPCRVKWITKPSSHRGEGGLLT